MHNAQNDEPSALLGETTPSAPVSTALIELPAVAEATRWAAPHATRRELRRRRRQAKTRAVLVPALSVTAAGLLLAGVTFAHPMVANAETPSGSAVTSTATPSAAAAPDESDELFARSSSQADARAAAVVTQATEVLDAVKGKVDTAPLVSSVASLANYAYLDTTTVQTLTTDAVTTMATAEAQAAAVDKAAADAAAAAAAAAAAEAQAAAERQALANTPDGARTVAAEMASEKYGWGSDQFQCLNSLWSKESGWNYQAENASSGAYGIPQSLPGSKMSSIADDWATNAITQISWGLDYIARGYGTPCSAWSHSQSVNWY